MGASLSKQLPGPELPSSPFDKSNDLQRMDFWLNGFRKTEAYGILEYNVVHGRVQWTFGVGPTSSFTRALLRILEEGTIKFHGPYDLVIKVDLNQAPKRRSLKVTHKLAIGIAEELGLLGPEYRTIKEDNDERHYYCYGLWEDSNAKMEHLIESVLPQIFQNLSTKRYLLVVNNLHETIESSAFTEQVGLPPPSWNRSIWLLMPTIHHGNYKTGGAEAEHLQQGRIAAASGKGDVSFTEDEILMLILYSVDQAAKDIYNTICHEDEQYWHQITLQCLHYAMLIVLTECSPPHGDEDQCSSDKLGAITADELIRHWAAQDILTVIDQRVQEKIKENNDSPSKHSGYYDIHQVGDVILEAFRECSLLQLPFSSATKADEATKTAAHFLASQGLIAERLTIDEFCGDNPGLEHMQWISQQGDQGWHVSKNWLSQGTNSGPTTLILRQSSQESILFSKLDKILADLPYLRVLDLSYTPLGSLPSSIYFLKNLQLLSLRGCCNLKNPFSFPNTENSGADNKINLLYLDLSYSNINTFHRNFFHDMPSLQELVLIKCSNLVQLPFSISVLSSLTTLEVTGTQIESFYGEGLKNLQSLKLIDNKKLSSFSVLVSKACFLMDQPIEGPESSSVQKEITLEGHPTLRSFALIEAPLIRRVSLRRCGKLEFVDIKQVDALEELDLSGTSITELPATIPNSPKLRQLFIMDVPSLKRFPWHELQRLPDVFRLGHSYILDGSNNWNQQAALVCVISDARLFYSFGQKGTNREVFKSFYVRVTPNNRRRTAKMMMSEEDIVVSTRRTIQLIKGSAYVDVNSHYISLVSRDVKPPFQETDRHVEISAMNQYAKGLGSLLQTSKSISMMYDDHFSGLDDFTCLDELEHCSLLQCRRMLHVFQKTQSYSLQSASGVHVRRFIRKHPLKSAFVSYLRSLTHFYRSLSGPADRFDALRHLRLEHCPRLEYLMPRESTLSSLETLDILFCYNVRELFYDHGERSPSPYELPCLRRIRLQELPLLEHLRSDDATLMAPMWEELHVRGCWSLRRLPRQSRRSRSSKVKVSGERTWWAKLRWDDEDEWHPHHSSYEPRLPPAAASMRDRVVIKTYLR